MIDKNVRNRAIKTTYLEYQGDINFIKDILLASDNLVSNDNITEDMIKKIFYELDDGVFFSGLNDSTKIMLFGPAIIRYKKPWYSLVLYGFWVHFGPNIG